MALRLGVFGYVRNMEKDKVFVVIEGEEKAVYKLIDFCHHGPENAQVEHVSVYMGEIGHYTSFSIRYS